MSVTAVVGSQWGDEGKGRIIDYLARTADLVMRFQGGDNAGHTVINQYGKHALHIIPSGIFNSHTVNVVGTGCVVNPQNLLEEMTALEAVGVKLDNLWISSRAQLLMPYHPLLDGLEEASRGQALIGTTKRGIGPAYADKAARNGLRMGDLLYQDWLASRLDSTLTHVNRKITLLGGDPVEKAEMLDLCLSYRDQLGERIVDSIPLVRQISEAGGNILLEGQLGVMRDLDWGIFPYVTSSNPTAAYAAAGGGFPVQLIQNVVGVVKAYSTAVGEGPFPVELQDAAGQKLRQIGEEFGATTGRPRRCGWFDGVAIKYAAWLNGLTRLAVTKLDVLDHFDTIKVCIGYRLPDGEMVTDSLPATPVLYQVEPVYESWEGWGSSTQQCRSWSDLPPQAQAYLDRICELAGVPIGYVSVGPERDQMFEVAATS